MNQNEDERLRSMNLFLKYQDISLQLAIESILEKHYMLALSKSDYFDTEKNKKRLLVIDQNQQLLEYRKTLGHFWRDETFLTQKISDPKDFIKKKRFKIEIISVFGASLHFIDTLLLNQLLRFSFYWMIDPKKLEIVFKPSNDIHSEFDTPRSQRLNPDIYNAYQKVKSMRDDIPIVSDQLNKSAKVNRFENQSLMLRNKEMIIDLLQEIDDKIRMRFNHLNKYIRLTKKVLMDQQYQDYLYKSTFKELLAKFLGIQDDCDFKEKAMEDFHKNLNASLIQLKIDPEEVEQNILAFKNYTAVDIVETLPNEVDSPKDNKEDIVHKSSRIHVNKNDEPLRSIISNESSLRNNKLLSHEDLKSKDTLNSKFLKDKQAETNHRNVRQVEFKLRSEDRQNERIKSVNKHQERQRELQFRKKNEIKGINPNNPQTQMYLNKQLPNRNATSFILPQPEKRVVKNESIRKKFKFSNIIFQDFDMNNLKNKSVGIQDQ